MKRVLIGLLLVISVVFIGSIIGGTIAKYFLVQPGDGLAAAGTAAIMAMLGGGIGLVLSFVLLRKLEEKTKMILAVILFAISLMIFGVLYHQFNERKLEKERENAALFSGVELDRHMRTTAQTERLSEDALPDLKLADGTEMGIGIVSISPEGARTLSFYSKPKSHDLPETASVVDSLTFKDAEYFVDIATAPPWFVPQYMNLDYGILHLVAVTAQKNWLEVIVNKTTGQTLWVYRPDVHFSYWPDFLLNVHSVELLRPNDFPPRIKPMNHASPIQNIHIDGPFYPVSVKDDWLQVIPDHEVDHEVWVKWKHDGILLVNYSMLS